MKSIDTLAEDIYDVLQSQPRGTPEEVADRLAGFGGRAAISLSKQLTERGERSAKKVLYASELGKTCPRQVWYAHNTPRLAAPIEATSKFKFVYGDMIEELVLTLAEQAGHEVADRQKVVEFYAKNGWVVRGRQDATIDGVVVDVKSASHFAMKKFEQGLDDSNDTFGYRAQLSFYNGPGKQDKARQGFVAVDKQTGLIKYFDSSWIPTNGIADALVETIEEAVEPPHLLSAKEDASFNNKKLCVTCSYCAFKTTCWRSANKNSGLLKLDYASGPVWLTDVKVPPKVASAWDIAPPDANDTVNEAIGELSGK
jgi:hypothetical protein